MATQSYPAPPEKIPPPAQVSAGAQQGYSHSYSGQQYNYQNQAPPPQGGYGQQPVYVQQPSGGGGGGVRNQNCWNCFYGMVQLASCIEMLVGLLR